jgi:hypothetical protein
MKTLKKIFNNLCFLSFLNGILLTSLFYFKSQSNFEDALFASINKNVRSTLKPGDSDDSMIVRSMHICYRLMHIRASVFMDDKTENNFISILNPVTVDLITARGACGSYSAVLARLLANDGYAVRIAQMKANGFFGAHNIVEVNIDRRWEVLDPTYDLYFIRPDGKIAGFADVRNNWSYYIPQLPKEYKLAYHYEDVRYTNWEKFPIIMPAIKKLLNMFMGADKANAISLHVYFLRIYAVCFYIALVLFLFQFIHTCRKIAAKYALPKYNFRILPGKGKQLLSPSAQSTG